MTLFDSCPLKLSINRGVDKLYLSNATSTNNSVVKLLVLVSIVTDQINVAGLQYVTGMLQCICFASQDLHVGKNTALLKTQKLLIFEQPTLENKWKLL